MTVDDGDMATWSDVNDDVLYLVTKQLRVVDFLAFSEVCKSWRSFALTNRKTFMASKPPMSICQSSIPNLSSSRNMFMGNEDDRFRLEDFEGKKFKTIIPHFAGRTCVGSTCGYLVFFGKKTRDFWLVNPITKHELSFLFYPLDVGVNFVRMRTILVFSRSISQWVFVVLCRKTSFYRETKGKLSFQIAGKLGWNHVSSTIPFEDLHFFKGKIYTLHTGLSLGELRLNLKCKRKWILLETTNSPNLYLMSPMLVSSDENLYLMDVNSELRKVMELDTGEMKWVLPEKTIGEYAFFLSYRNYSAAIKPESWLGLRTQYKSCNYLPHTDKSQQQSPCYHSHSHMWYFPHDCLNVNFIDE